MSSHLYFVQQRICPLSKRLNLSWFVTCVVEVRVITLVEKVLDMRTERDAQFNLVNQQTITGKFCCALFSHYWAIEKMGGDKVGLFAKDTGHLIPDAYFPHPYHFFFDFDELQHFTSYRQRTLLFNPTGAPLAFNLKTYSQFCAQTSLGRI